MSVASSLPRRLGVLLLFLLICICYTAAAPLPEEADVSALRKDYYSIFELGKKSTMKEIKKAYRTLSMLYHPDKNPSEEAKEKFAKLAEAYEVLSDPERRAFYDSMGFDKEIDKSKKREKSVLDPDAIQGTRSPNDDMKEFYQRWSTPRERFQVRMKEREEEQWLRDAGMHEHSDFPKKSEL